MLLCITIQVYRWYKETKPFEKKSLQLRDSHRESEKTILVTCKTKEKLDDVYRLKQENLARDIENKNKIVNAVKADGGLCMSSKDVENVLKQIKEDKRK